MREFKFEHLEKLISTIRNIVLRIKSMGEFQMVSNGRLTWRIEQNRSDPNIISGWYITAWAVSINEERELDWKRIKKRFLDVIQDHHTGKLRWDWSDIRVIEMQFNFREK